MGQLSSESGVAVPTIKYYQREGLLHAGVLTSPTQASYDDSHVERLKLIRALIDIGALPVASAKNVIAAIDDPDLPLTWTFGVAQHAITQTVSPPAGSDGSGMVAVHSALDAAGIRVNDENPGLAIAAGVLDSYRQLGHDELAEIVGEYLRAALIVAEADLDAVASRAGRGGMAQTVVVGTVLGDALSAGLRRIAQEHVSNVRFPAPTDARPSPRFHPDSN